MSTPGWYPDPAGQANTFRYWDGNAWSHETSPSPYVAPPGSVTQPPPPPPPFPPTQPMPSVPQPPPGYGSGAGGPGWQQVPQPAPYAPVPPPPRRSGRKVALILLVVLLIAGAAVGGFFGVRALTDDSGDSSGTDETSESVSPSESEAPAESPTLDPSPADPSAPAPIMSACTGAAPEGGTSAGGVLRGGGLTAPRPRGFEPAAIEPTFTFADQVVTVARQIEEQWIAVYALGGLPTAPGYSGPDQAAETVLSCVAASETFYRHFESRTDLESEPVTVDGHAGWRITSELRIDDPEINQEGDHATVIVVETGSADRYGLFVSVVPIGDQPMIDQQQSVIDSLQVTGSSA